jgi:cytochrome c oxidase assembly protein subunit 15
MDHDRLYDLAPLGHMMLVGILIASLPLLWVWWRHRQGKTTSRLATLTGVTLFLTFDLVLFGAFTRLTDSGLGCPDWPGCYGSLSPIGASTQIAASQELMPDGPVTFPKAWIEMIHRYLATGVGVLILILAVTSWLKRRQLRMSVFWPMVTLFWVCMQGAFGALTVTMKLFPAIVTLHLLGGMGLLALLRLQTVRYAQNHHNLTGLLPDSSQYWSPGLKLGLWLVFALVWMQIALGGWVSTNYAVLACQDFPKCHGTWWPEMDFAAGFEIWRELGMRGSGEGIPVYALTAIHYTHRLFAYVVLLAVGLLAWRLWVHDKRSQAMIIAALGMWQLLTGLTNVVLEWPLVAAVSHTGGAAGMVIALSGWLTWAHQPKEFRHHYGLGGRWS